MAVRKPDEKVERIILAAVEEFARAGPEGARVDSIARAAGMNKRLLYHYVGDKDALFEAAVHASRIRLEQTVSAPEQVPPEVWRILCHAVAMDGESGFGPVEAASVGSDESASAVELRLALAMFRSLLAPLAAALGQDLRSAGQTVPVVSSDEGQKPRIKLKPEVRRLS
jgi:AcrR family transcriptional regulator